MHLFLIYAIENHKKNEIDIVTHREYKRYNAVFNKALFYALQEKFYVSISMEYKNSINFYLLYSDAI